MDVKLGFKVTVAIWLFLSFVLLYLLFASIYMDGKFDFKVTVAICSFLGFILLNLVFASILILNLS